MTCSARAASRVEMFDCCVDIGYEAQDTPGNADETMHWAADQRFSKLIIVTSSYHMPRSLTELGRVMPDVKLVPYPVVTQGFRKDRWWRDFGTARILLSEYVKFLPSAARFGVARLLRIVGRQRVRRRRGHARRPPVSDALLVARSLLFLVVFYVNTAVFLVLGSWLLAAPRRWAMQGLQAARPGQPVVAEADLRHARRGARSREAA